MVLPFFTASLRAIPFACVSELRLADCLSISAAFSLLIPKYFAVRSIISVVLDMRKEYAMRICLQGLFYALRSFFSPVGFRHDLEAMPRPRPDQARRPAGVSGDYGFFLDSSERPA